MKLVRKRKLFFVVLATSMLTLVLLLTQPVLRDGKVEIDLAHLPKQFALDVQKTQPVVAGHPSNLGQVKSNKSTHQGLKRTCSPVVNIAFVKTHKAGSSTVANILQRFGIKRNLSFALPNTKYRAYGYNYISRAGDILKPSKLLPLKNGSHHGYNILYNHAIYNRTAFRMIMPSDTHYISILREPFSQFVSAFEYYGIRAMFAKNDKSILKAKNPISTYLQNPYRFEKKLQYFSYVKNKQAEDLGLGWNEYFVPSRLTRYLETLQRDFTLFMIMEYFDESLLLLKRKLCWDLKDILYIPKNKNTNKPKRNFTDVDHKRHEKLSHLDYKLYTFFLNSFEADLKNQTEDFFEELAYFKSLLREVYNSCTSGTMFYAKETHWHDAFYLDKTDCRLMLITELSGFDLLLERAGALNWTSIHSYEAKQRAYLGSNARVLKKSGVKVIKQGDKGNSKSNGTHIHNQKGMQDGIKNGIVGQEKHIDKSDNAKLAVIGDSEKRGADTSAKNDQLAALPVVGVGGVAQAVIQGNGVARDESGINVLEKG